MYTCIAYACSNCLLFSCELNNCKKSKPPFTVQKMQAHQFIAKNQGVTLSWKVLMDEGVARPMCVFVDSFQHWGKLFLLSPIRSYTTVVDSLIQ